MAFGAMIKSGNIEPEVGEGAEDVSERINWSEEARSAVSSKSCESLFKEENKA